MINISEITEAIIASNCPIEVRYIILDNSVRSKDISSLVDNFKARTSSFVANSFFVDQF